MTPEEERLEESDWYLMLAGINTGYALERLTSVLGCVLAGAMRMARANQHDTVQLFQMALDDLDKSTELLAEGGAS
jgi:hypothetical protein